MRGVLLLASLVSILAQNGTNNTACTPITRPQLANYTPRAYRESSRVSQLSAYSSESFCTNLVSDYTACKSYMKQLGGMVAGPIVVTVIAMIALLFFLCCRSEKCCGCQLPFRKLWMYKLLLGILLACSFIAIYASFSGSGDFKTGADNLGRAITNVEATAENVNIQLRNGLNGCLVLQNGSSGVSGGHCDTGYAPYDLQIRQYGQDISNQIPGVQDPINNALSQMNFTYRLDEIRSAIVDNSQRNIDRAFYAIIGIYTLALLFGVLGITCSSFMLNAQLCLGTTNVIIAGVFIGIELAFSVGVSDFCDPNPRVTILGLINSSGTSTEALTALQYMMTCVGQNPVQNRSDDILLGMAALQNKTCVGSVNSTSPECMADINSIQTGLGSLFDSTNLFLGTIGSCKFFNEPLILLTDDALCTNMVDGLYAMWTCQMVATIFLILALFVTPCVKARMREEKEGPVADAKRRASSEQRRDSRDPPVVPSSYVAYVPPPTDNAPPPYASVEMEQTQRDKLGDPV